MVHNTRYDKLVRDRIPDIIRRDGKEAVTHSADDKEYWTKLQEKLREEVDEFLEHGTTEELADILEVIDAICTHMGFDMVEIDRIKNKKRQERGGFSKRIILEQTRY
jgi:predicted house-cleaning noncanonical NTP pyrophosphatase (MazG superfamily)